MENKITFFSILVVSFTILSWFNVPSVSGYFKQNVFKSGLRQDMQELCPKVS